MQSNCNQRSFHKLSRCDSCTCLYMMHMRLHHSVQRKRGVASALHRAGAGYVSQTEGFPELCVDHAVTRFCALRSVAQGTRCQHGEFLSHLAGLESFSCYTSWAPLAYIGRVISTQPLYASDLGDGSCSFCTAISSAADGCCFSLVVQRQQYEAPGGTYRKCLTPLHAQQTRVRGCELSRAIGL